VLSADTIFQKGRSARHRLTTGSHGTEAEFLVVRVELVGFPAFLNSSPAGPRHRARSCVETDDRPTLKGFPATGYPASQGESLPAFEPGIPRRIRSAAGNWQHLQLQLADCPPGSGVRLLRSVS